MVNVIQCTVLLSIKSIESCISLVTYMTFMYKDAQSNEHKKNCDVFV